MRNPVIRAGDLRHSIQIQAETVTYDAGGGGPSTFTTVAGGACRASINPSAGRERYLGGALQGEVSHEIKTRYLAGVSNEHTVLLADGRRFQVVSVLDWGNRHVEMSLFCVERKAQV